MAIQASTGLVSGLDTASIVEALMQVQRTSYNRVSEKVETEKLRLEAYQSVNGMLSSLKTSVNSLNSSALWNAKATTSSNESSLSASATQYAVEGSYSLRVAQLATTTQYMTKGYSNQTSAVIPSGSYQKSGTITLESSKARVDNSAKLEELNGGNGVFRGSVRITDASGSSCVVDLSACETLDEVINELNGAAGIQIEASVGEDGSSITIVDDSGVSGTMKIQNVGLGTTATDLGIAGSSTQNADGVAVMNGSSIYYMGQNTALTSLRDGLGVEQGSICITVKGASGSVDVYVDLSEAETVSDVLNSTNAALKETAAGDAAAADLIGNLKLAINDDANGFTFTGGQVGNTYTIAPLYEADSSGNMQLKQPLTGEQLGLQGTFQVSANGESFGGTRLLGDVSSPMLSSLSGANKTGIGSDSSLPTVADSTLSGSTKLSALNGGSGVDGTSPAFQVAIGLNGDALSTFTYSDLLDSDQLRYINSNPDATLDDLLSFMGDSLRNSGIAGLENIDFAIDSDAKGIYITGLSGVYDYQFAGSIAESLGIVYLGDGTDSMGWGATITGTVPPEVDDLYSYNSVNNGSMLLGTSTLGSLYEQTGTYGEKIDDAATIGNAAMESLLAGGMSVSIGGQTHTLSFDSLDGDSTINDILNSINTQLVGFGVNAYVDVGSDMLGLTWENVSLGEDFTVTGGLADFFGIDKNFTGISAGQVSTSVQKNLNPVVVGTAEAVDLDGGQKLSSLNGGAGLSLQGESLTVDFELDGNGNTATVSVTREEILGALEGIGKNIGTATVDEYLGVLNDLFADKIGQNSSLASTSAAVQFGISDDLTGITVTAVSAPAGEDGLTVTVGGNLAGAGASGIAAFGVKTGADFEVPEPYDIRGVTTTEATVSGVGYIRMEVDGTEVVLNTNGLDSSSTLDDLIRTLNSQLADKGYSDMSFGVSDSGTGLAFTNDSSDEVTFKYDDVSTLASDLGLCGTADEKTDTTVAANSHQNCSSLNRNYVDRSTLLSTLNNGKGADLGVITVTNAEGTSVHIDLADETTVGGVIDAINGLLTGVRARINDAGDGIIIEQTSNGTGSITVTNYDGNKTAEHLGIAGTSKAGEDGVHRLDGSMKTVITVSETDTLNDIMTRISNLDAGYKASIINDGSGTNSYRLSISSGSTGAACDFIIDTDIDALTMQQVSKGQDAIVLYGEADSGASPILLKTSTNSNSQAILGLTLDLKSVSDSYTTISVTADTEKVVEEFQNLVQCFNDLSDIITYLDSYDSTTEEKGICYGDSTLRTLMDTIEENFYGVYNPNGLTSGEISASKTKSTWTWSDLGISFVANNSSEDGESGYWYSRMELDLDALGEMVSTNWDVLKEMISGQTNVSDSTRSSNVAASASFNYKKEYDADGNLVGEYDDPNQAINGDKTTSNFGNGNGVCGNKTIAEGENQYTIYFQESVSLDRVSIYYPSADESLRDFTVEYLDPVTGNWETLREFTDTEASSTIIGISTSNKVSGIRITATDTNAEDGKFKLVDVQCLASTGLGGSLSQTMNELTDVVDGYFTSANSDVEDNIAALKEQMEKMEDRLTKKEESLYRKFNAMESALSQLQNQSDTLTTLFSSLNSSSD